MTRRPRFTAAHSLAKFSLLALAVIGIYLYRLTLPVASKASVQEFMVEKGESVKTIATRLKSDDLIRSPLFFRLIVREQKLSLQAGMFQLSPSFTPSEIAQALTKGLAKDQKITIPEGFRAEQIAETAGIPTREFLLAAKGLEGELFPDTYFLKEGITAQELVSLMHENFVKKVGSISPEDLVLASLVERETRGNAEKPIVAGILKKRLQTGWSLDLDATVQYVRGKAGDWWPNTTLLDRALVSPYNTYLHQGLPPSPICNPGLAAINAVRNSAASDYWFYLHDGDGKIHYGKTLEEHNQNIEDFIR